ncbi:MAG: peroxiredoxin family protein [Actinomycetota bacterium]
MTTFRPRTSRKPGAKRTGLLVWTITGLLVVVLVLVGLATQRGDDGETVVTTARTEPRVGSRAPGFSVRTIEGERLTLADVRGKPTVLYFTAYSCFTCIPKLQQLGQVYERVANRGLEVMAIDIDPSSTPELFAAFRRAAGSPPFAFALDDAGHSARAYKVLATAWTVAIDRAGVVRYAADYETAAVRRAIEDMLG